MLVSVTPIAAPCPVTPSGGAIPAPVENVAGVCASCKLAGLMQARRAIGAGLFVSIVLLLAVRADAAGGSRLVYGRATGASACPDESELRAAVRARLGYDPFFPWADQTVVVHLAPRPTGRVSGKAYLVDSQGRASPEREFTTTVAECGELIQTLSLAIVITLDPLHGTTAAAPNKRAAIPEPDDSNGQTSSPASAGSDPRATSQAAPASVDPPAPVASAGSGTSDDRGVDRGKAKDGNFATALDVGGGAILGSGLMPGISAGFVPFVRARKGIGSLALEGRYEVAVWHPFGTDRADVSLIGGSITPCVYAMVVFKACPTLLLARYRAEGIDAPSLMDSALFASAGLRAGGELPLGPRVSGFLWIEGLINLTRHDLWVAGERIWQVPPFGFTFSAGAATSIL